MNHEDRDIDALLRRNVERQLGSFDWQGFSRGIDARMTLAGARSRSWNSYRKWAAIAAGAVLAAGVLIFAVISATRPGPHDSTSSEAKVAMIETARPLGTARVSFRPAETPARCEVTILASGKPQQQESRTQASWCIIAARDLSDEKPRNGRDASDVLCLF